MSTMRVLAIMMAAALSATGCGAAERVEQEVKKETGLGGISAEEYQGVAKDATLEEVKEQFGAPTNEQNSEVEVPSVTGKPTTQTTDCIYYNAKDVSGQYQFCFMNGKLLSRAKY